MDGWISIKRTIKEHWIWQDPVKLKWWLDLLITANHQAKKVNIGNKLFECDRGQTIQSLSNWAKQWGVSKDKARNFFELLKNDGMIRCENIVKSTRITICNYDNYQSITHATQTQDQRIPNAFQTQSHPNNNDNNENNDNKEIESENGVDTPDALDFQKIVDLYHSICKSFPKVTKLTDKRKMKIRVRFVKEMKENWNLLETIFAKMENSKFLQGDNNRGWKADFDWVFANESNWVKINEDKYKDKSEKRDTSKFCNDEWK